MKCRASGGIVVRGGDAARFAHPNAMYSDMMSSIFSECSSLPEVLIDASKRLWHSFRSSCASWLQCGKVSLQP